MQFTIYAGVNQGRASRLISLFQSKVMRAYRVLIYFGQHFAF